MYTLYCAHDGYAMLCAYGVVRMLDMWYCVHMVLCKCRICSAIYIWCGVHVVHVVLCTYGIVCIIVYRALCASGVVWMNVHMVLYACGVVYISYCVHIVHVV